MDNNEHADTSTEYVAPEIQVLGPLAELTQGAEPQCVGSY